MMDILRERWPSLVTAAGSIPLFGYALLAGHFSIPVLYAQIYFCLILAFIAGIDWTYALIERSLLSLLWSVLLSLLSLLLLLVSFYYSISTVIVWLLLLTLLWLALLHDFIIRKKVNIPGFFCFRRSGTLFLTVAVFLILAN
jgi:hypothetical protein